MGDKLDHSKGSSIKATCKIVQIPINDACLGRVVNALVQPIDGKGQILALEFKLIESLTLGIISKRFVYEPM